jgi:Family of unknown function (DUF6335)
MAKRKAARATRRKGASPRRGAARGRSAPRKAARTRAAKKAKKTARARVRRPAKQAARKAKAPARKTAARRPLQAKVKAKAKAKTTKAKTSKAKTTSAKLTSAPARPKAPRPAPSARAAVAKVPVRTAPSLNRERRTIADDDIVQSPPSSLDLDRSASAVRSGRKELKERLAEHTETSPALTGGDVDADWESAYAVGDEAPGGDNPTPDQDLVDDIGHAIGVEYQDNEELKGEAKIAKRDRNRWELDPASSDDWDER